jgi:hypothetical protein
MIYCDKNNHCIAKFGHQQKHCEESLLDIPLSEMCQWWNYPDLCGVGEGIKDEKKVRCSCIEKELKRGFITHRHES